MLTGVRGLGSMVLMLLPPIFWVNDSTNEVPRTAPIPKGHLEDLTLVHMLGPVVVAM